MRVRSLCSALVLMGLVAGFAADSEAGSRVPRPARATAKQMAAVRAKGEEVPARARRLYEPRLAAISAEVDLEAMADEPSVASRLAAEFGVTADHLMEERSRLGGAWSDLMIAYTLRANAQTPLGVDQICDLHREGMAWTQVAYGLGLRLVQVVSAVQAESKVAVGDVPPDGRVHGITSGLSAGTSVGQSIPPAPRASVLAVRVGRF